MSIYVWAGRINYPAMRWPCPYGYHVGRRNIDWSNIISAWVTLWAWTSSGWTNLSTYLKMPFAWHRGTTGSITQQWTYWYYYTCETSTANNKLEYQNVSINSSSITNWQLLGWAYWNSIRPVKDEPVAPTSSWTTLYDWSSVAAGAGIFWSSSLWLISISRDWTTWWTIADKNLWATTVRNSWDALSEANCWKYFQWWNNYPFPRTWSVTTSSTKANASWYWPWNWYYSKTFITSTQWDSSDNANLRWWIVWAVKADVKDICVGAGVDDYSVMQWPCPDWFHIATQVERQWIYSANTWAWSAWQWNIMSQYLKMPLAWYLNISGSQANNWVQWTYYSTSIWLYLNMRSSQLTLISSAGWAYWTSIRPLKNTPVQPDSTRTTLFSGTDWKWIWRSKWLGLITLYNWSKRFTIADKNLWAKKVWNSGDALSEDNCGFYYQSWNNYWFPYSWPSSTSTSQVDVSNYWPSYPYYSNTFIKRSSSPYQWWYSNIYRPWKTSSTYYDLRWDQTWKWAKGNVKQVYVWTTIARPTYNPWIYWNKAKWLISISSDWKNWITIADKNMGAKVVYNLGDTMNQDNCWRYYQRWNNYWFPYTWSVTNTSTKPNATWYWPTNPYCSSIFVTWWSTSPYDWSSNKNDNLRGNTTNTLEARQWPCPTWFHVPTQSDLESIVSILWDADKFWLQKSVTTIGTYLKMPACWYRNRSTSNVWFQSGSVARYRGSTSYSTGSSYFLDGGSSSLSCSRDYRSAWNSLRPFKNEPVVPDNSRAVLYQPS